MPTDLTPFLSATPAAILAVAVATSLLKPFLERTVLPAQAPLHDAVVRLGAVLLGVTLVVVATLLSLTPHQTAAGGLLFSAAIEGAKSGVFAVAAYHLLTGSVFEQNAGVIMAPAPHGTEPSAVVVAPQAAPQVVVVPPADTQTAAPALILPPTAGETPAAPPVEAGG